MSDHDKMVAFGTWLTTRKEQHTSELFQLAINVNRPAEHLRLKAGHLEATSHILKAFADLYNGDLPTFSKDYLGIEPEKEEEKESDDSNA